MSKGSNKETRPFHIWDERAKQNLPWRYYITEKAAIEKALVLVYWLELGNSYTVYDARTYEPSVQFTRRISGVIASEVHHQRKQEE